MRTTTITIDYAHPRGYEIGYQGENNIVNLVLPVPSHIEGADGYRVYFESSAGEYLQTELLTPVDGCVTVTLTSDIIPAPGQIAAQLVAFADGDIIGKAPVIYGTALYAIPSGSTEQVSKSIEAEIALNSAARHSHANKAVLDLLSESDGKPTYNGEALGGGASTAEDISYTLSEDVQTTFPDIVELESDTVKSGLDVAMYYAIAGMFAKNIACDVPTATGTTTVELQSTLDGFVFPAMVKAHEHANKDTLDLLSVSNGKLQYNGSDVGLKGDKGDKGDPGSDANVTKDNVVAALGYTPEAVSAQVSTGSNITLADNTEYRLADVTTLTLNYPTSDFECWMRLTFAASGNATVTLPTGTKYIGTTPDFKNGETWELSIKDGVVIAQKVGEGA